eukprot:c20471_g1_i2 orf=435-806(+)
MGSPQVLIPDVPKSLFGAKDTGTGNVHVLAVDDSVIDRRVIESLLKTSAYKVTAVDSGRRALEILGVGETLGPVSFNVSPGSCSISTDISASEVLFSLRPGGHFAFVSNLMLRDICAHVAHVG